MNAKHHSPAIAALALAFAMLLAFGASRSDPLTLRFGAQPPDTGGPSVPQIPVVLEQMARPTAAIRPAERAPSSSPTPATPPAPSSAVAPPPKKALPIDPSKPAQLLIVPHAGIGERALQAQAGAQAPEERLHLHYRGDEPHNRREPFYVRVVGPSDPEERRRWSPQVPRVEVLDQEGRPHTQLWAIYFGQDRVRLDGMLVPVKIPLDLTAQGSVPPLGMDTAVPGWTEFAFVLQGQHVPWALVECKVRATIPSASATMELILSPALESEWVHFGSSDNRRAMAIVRVLDDIEATDVSAQFTRGGQPVAISRTTTSRFSCAPELPRYEDDWAHGWRVFRWHWDELPWPLEQPRIRIRVLFPNGFQYERILKPGEGKRL